jgi:hypothetical protein
MYTCCGIKDCDLGGGHPTSSAFGNGNCFLSSFCGSTINSSCDEYCPLGLGKSILGLVVNMLWEQIIMTLVFLKLLEAIIALKQ